jgi:starvation-inducible DNA-binding protein
MNNYKSLLNRQVANFGVLYTKLHNFHWFVKGFQFYQLHQLFEGFYDEATETLDAIAERLLMLGEKPYATLSAFLQYATIKEASGNETLVEMVKATLADFELLNKELTEIVKGAQEAGDEVTVDMILGIQGGLQKHVWMLKAVLG